MIYSIAFWAVYRVVYFVWPGQPENNAEYKKQSESYNEQTKRADEMFVQAERQQARTNAMLSKQEEQAKRLDAILERWEKQTGIRR